MKLGLALILLLLLDWNEVSVIIFIQGGEIAGLAQEANRGGGVVSVDRVAQVFDHGI